MALETTESEDDMNLQKIISYVLEQEAKVAVTDEMIKRVLEVVRKKINVGEFDNKQNGRDHGKVI